MAEDEKDKAARRALEACDEEKKRATISDVLCKGCGVCAAACSAGARPPLVAV